MGTAASAMELERRVGARYAAVTPILFLKYVIHQGQAMPTWARVKLTKEGDILQTRWCHQSIPKSRLTWVKRNGRFKLTPSECYEQLVRLFVYNVMSHKSCIRQRTVTLMTAWLQRARLAITTRHERAQDVPLTSQVTQLSNGTTQVETTCSRPGCKFHYSKRIVCPCGAQSWTTITRETEGYSCERSFCGWGRWDCGCRPSVTVPVARVCSACGFRISLE